MARRPKRLKQQAWDASKARYASLDHPEWVLMRRLPSGFWKDVNNLKQYLKWLGKELGIKRPEDWYKVRHQDFKKNRGGGFLDQFEGSHIKALQTLFTITGMTSRTSENTSNGLRIALESNEELTGINSLRMTCFTTTG